MKSDDREPLIGIVASSIPWWGTGAIIAGYHGWGFWAAVFWPFWVLDALIKFAS